MSFFSQFQKSRRRIVDETLRFKKGEDVAEPVANRVANRGPAPLPSCAPPKKSQRSIRRQLKKRKGEAGETQRSWIFRGALKGNKKTGGRVTLVPVAAFPRPFSGQQRPPVWDTKGQGHTQGRAGPGETQAGAKSSRDALGRRNQSQRGHALLPGVTSSQQLFQPPRLNG